MALDVHVAREQVTSWQDFLVRYLLIVAGILSAWAVNQWNEARQHRQIAEQTRAALSEELRSNLAEIRKARGMNTEETDSVRALRRQLVAALKAGRPMAQIEAEIVPLWSGQLRETLPQLRQDGWEAAVAGQAVTHLRADELRRFSAGYSALRLLDRNNLNVGSGVAGDLLRRYTEWGLNRQLGRTDVVELTRLLVLWESVVQYNAALLAGVEEDLGTALGTAVAPAASAASTASTASAASR